MKPSRRSLVRTAGVMLLVLGTGMASELVDRTAMLQAAIDRAAPGSTVRIPPGIHRCRNLVVFDKHDLELVGHGATIVWTGKPNGDGRVGLELRGLVERVRISGLRMVGDGTTASRHAGVWSRSGQRLVDVVIEGNDISHVTLGISVNADLGGALARIEIRDNDIDDVVGIDPGLGYGIHVASAQSEPVDVRVSGNRIARTQRHAIYQARGRGVVIDRNTVVEHRSGVAIGALRPAIVVARSHDVDVLDNIVREHADGGILVTAAGVPTGHIVVRGNTLTDAKNGVPSIVIGSQDPTLEGSPTDVIVERNRVLRGRGEALRILGPLHGRVRDNDLEDG